MFESHRLMHQALHREGNDPRVCSRERHGRYPVSVHFLKQHWWHPTTLDLKMRHPEYISSDVPVSEKESQNKMYGKQERERQKPLLVHDAEAETTFSISENICC